MVTVCKGWPSAKTAQEQAGLHRQDAVQAPPRAKTKKMRLFLEKTQPFRSRPAFYSALSDSYNAMQDSYIVL